MITFGQSLILMIVGQCEQSPDLLFILPVLSLRFIRLPMNNIDSISIKALEAHADSLQSKVDLLQARLDGMEYKTEFLSNVVGTANDGVSNQLSAANNLLVLFSVIIGILGIWLGIYVTKKKQQIEQLAAIVDTKKKAVDAIALATEDLDKKIHSDLSGLYKDLRKEETDALLNRLILEPQDVDNLCTILCARDIDESGYEKLKTAYLKMKDMLKDESTDNVVNDCTDHYFALFYQHFFYQALKDGEISQEFENYYYEIFARAYKRDVINSTLDLCKSISEDANNCNKEVVLATYLKALNSSRYSNLRELRSIFEHNITPPSLLQNAIERCKEEKVDLQLFNTSSE